MHDVLDDELKRLVFTYVPTDKLMDEALDRFKRRGWIDDDSSLHDLLAELMVAGLLPCRSLKVFLNMLNLTSFRIRGKNGNRQRLHLCPPSDAPYRLPLR